MPRSCFTSAALAAAVLASGCASLAPAAAPASALPALPAAWSAPATTANATPLQQWWMQFHDPQLDGLVADALARHTSVRDAQVALQGARAARSSALAGLSPTLGGSTSAGRSRSAATGARSNSWQLGLDAGWELDLFGAQRSSVGSADAELARSAANLAQAQVSLAAEVVLAWLDVRSAQARLALARQTQQAQADSQQITAWRVAAGLDSAVSLASARSAQAQAEAAVPALQATLAQARHALAVLSGRTPADLDAALAAPAEASLPPQPTEPVPALPAELLRQRPDVRAAELAVLSARHTLDAVRARRWPSLTLSGTLALQAGTLGGLGAAPLAGSALASLAGSLFDGGARQAAVDSQDATLLRAQIAWEAAVLQALQEVEDALANLAGQRGKASALQRALAAADDAATLARQRYASGLIDYASVLDTQRTLISTRDSLAVTRAAALAAQVQLVKALGGGWSPGASLAAADQR